MRCERAPHTNRSNQCLGLKPITILTTITMPLQWYGMVWYGMVWYGMVWYGMVWYGMVWYGMVWYAKRLVGFQYDLWHFCHHQGTSRVTMCVFCNPTLQRNIVGEEAKRLLNPYCLRVSKMENNQSGYKPLKAPISGRGEPKGLGQMA